MLHGNCCVCGGHNDVKTMRICSDSKMPAHHVTDGCIRICMLCKAAMTVDLTMFAGPGGTVQKPLKEIVAEFVKTFCSEVWHGDKPPTYYQLSAALNEVGILSPTGQLWQYSNLMQFMLRCNIRRDGEAAAKAQSIAMSMSEAAAAARSLSGKSLLNEIPDAPPPSEAYIDEIAAASEMPTGFPGM